MSSDDSIYMNEFICPLSCAYIDDPVMLDDDQIYEYDEVIKYFNYCKKNRSPIISPMTRAVISTKIRQISKEKQDIFNKCIQLKKYNELKYISASSMVEMLLNYDISAFNINKFLEKNVFDVNDNEHRRYRFTNETLTLFFTEMTNEFFELLLTKCNFNICSINEFYQKFVDYLFEEGIIHDRIDISEFDFRSIYMFAINTNNIELFKKLAELNISPYIDDINILWYAYEKLNIDFVIEISKTFPDLITKKVVSDDRVYNVVDAPILMNYPPDLITYFYNQLIEKNIQVVISKDCVKQLFSINMNGVYIPSIDLLIPLLKFTVRTLRENEVFVHNLIRSFRILLEFNTHSLEYDYLYNILINIKNNKPVVIIN